MRITLYKLTTGTVLDATALRDGSGYNAVPTKAMAGVTMSLLVKGTPPNEPKWVGELRGLTSDDSLLSALGTSSSGAVLLVKRGPDVFAVTFGSGFQAVHPSKIVTGFGLRVAANAIAKVKSAQTKMLASAGRSQMTVLPEHGELAALGIEPLEEWVRQLSGGVTDPTFAKTAAGSDSLRLTIKDFSLKGLPEKLKQISALHKSTAYKTQFGFLDNFRQLDPKIDKALIGKLDAGVLTRIRATDKSVFFAAPEPFDIPDVDSYTITRNKTRAIPDLTQDDVYGALAELNLTHDEALRQVKVRALDGDGNNYGQTFTLRDCLQAEVNEGEKKYVLSSGRWFQVAKDYIEQVDEFLKTVEDITPDLNLPAWGKNAGKHEDEGEYNVRIAGQQGYALLDKDNLQLGGHQKVEICDLLTAERHLICVKRATRSSTLSHLFAQGSVSASLMYRDDYRDKIVAGLKTVGVDEPFGEQSAWTIVYAIATEKTGDLLEELFFFSRMNLMNHVQDVRSRGIKVVVARIPMA